MAKGFQKGNTGKPKGSKNKRTIQWDEFGKELITSGISRAQRIMDESNNKDFMFYFNNLLEYFQPKLQRTDGTIKITPMPSPQVIAPK